jgi:hypothetical protein
MKGRDFAFEESAASMPEATVKKSLWVAVAAAPLDVRKA